MIGSEVFFTYQGMEMWGTLQNTTPDHLYVDYGGLPPVGPIMVLREDVIVDPNAARIEVIKAACRTRTFANLVALNCFL